MAFHRVRGLVLLVSWGMAFAAVAQTGCNSGSLRPYDQPPINGNPMPISSSSDTIIEAEYFNCGGQNVAYHDNAAVTALQVLPRVLSILPERHKTSDEAADAAPE